MCCLSFVCRTLLLSATISLVSVWHLSSVSEAVPFKIVIEAVATNGAAQPQKGCPHEWSEVRQADAGFSVCAPNGWKLRTRGSEYVLSNGNATELVVSPQVKVTSPQDLLDLLVPFLKKSQAEIDTLTPDSLKYIGPKGQGLAFGKHLHRFGALVYSSCSGDESECASSLVVAQKFSESFVFLGESSVPFDEWTKVETAHLVVLAYPQGATVTDAQWIAQEYEAGYKKIIAQLGLPETGGKVKCFFYPSKRYLALYTRRDSGFAITQKDEIHSWYEGKTNRQSTGHEMTHVLTYRAWGDPSEAILGEGIAVALDLSEGDVHLEAVEALGDQLGEFSLSSLVGQLWFEQKPEIAYAVSGSFAKFLLDRGGSSKFARIYRAKDFLSALKELYGLTLEQAQDAWLDGMVK